MKRHAKGDLFWYTSNPCCYFVGYVLQIALLKPYAHSHKFTQCADNQVAGSTETLSQGLIHKGCARAEFELLMRSFLSFTVGWHVRALANRLRWSAQVYNGLSPLELDRITTYSKEIEPRAGTPTRYVPRSTQVDLEGGVIKSVSPVACYLLIKSDKWRHVSQTVASKRDIASTLPA